MVLKTQSEIQHLIELVDTTLDVNGDGEVTQSELMDNFALVSDELEFFDIMTVDDLRFWTTLYTPGTDVERTLDGQFTALEAPQSLRAKCKDLYEEGYLLDYALQIDGATSTDLEGFASQITDWENQWQEYYQTAMSRFESGAMRKNNVKKCFEDLCYHDKWKEMGLDPGQVFEQLSPQEQKVIYTGVLLHYFLTNKAGIKWDDEQSNMVTFMKTHKGNCAVVAILAQHLFRITGTTDYQSIVLPNHITLSFETAQGTLYLETSGGFNFNPPNYYEKRTDGDVVKRDLQTEQEPWQTLGATYSNAGYRLVLAREWELAKVELEAALDLIPDSTTANHLMGKTLMALGDKAGAIKHFRKALDVSPGYSDSQKMLEQLGLYG